MATYTERVTEIANLVAALPGAGKVYNRSRNTPFWEKFVLLFKDGNRINGWQITRKRGVPEAPRWKETYILLKVVGMHDASASDLDFQTQLDAAVALFRDGANLSFGEVADGLRIPIIEERMFGDVVCHYAECELDVSLYYREV